jgi:hypothetical protein
MTGIQKTLPIAILVFFAFQGWGQVDIVRKAFTVPYDSNYISSYSTDYTTRLYSSIKYSMMGYDDGNVSERLAYKPNNKMLLGIGVNHGILGLNIGINLPFINEDDDKYGETKYYDFTLRVFAPKFNLTGYLQNYRGFYLRNTSTMIQGWQEGDPYYIRPDVRTNTIGLDISYIFNNSRFSIRSAVVQTEWQKKSAGSMIVGGSIIYNVTVGDSSLVPTRIISPYFYGGLDFNRSDNFSIGPQIGYAYTLVIKRHFFITGSINGALNAGFTRLQPVDDEDKIKSGLIAGFRTEVLISAGYNSSRWYFGMSYMNMGITNQAPLPDCSISYDTGMFRMNVVRRFHTRQPIRLLNPGV